MNKFALILISIAVLIALYFGYLKFMGKSMKSNAYIEQPDLEEEQSKKAQAIRKKQKLLMEEREMRLRDYQGRR